MGKRGRINYRRRQGNHFNRNPGYRWIGGEDNQKWSFKLQR